MSPHLFHLSLVLGGERGLPSNLETITPKEEEAPVITLKQKRIDEEKT